MGVYPCHVYFVCLRWTQKGGGDVPGETPHLSVGTLLVRANGDVMVAIPCGSVVLPVCGRLILSEVSDYVVQWMFLSFGVKVVFPLCHLLGRTLGPPPIPIMYKCVGNNNGLTWQRLEFQA